MSPDAASLSSVAITVDSSQAIFTGDGATTVFSTVFPFIQASDVKVEKKLAAGTNYSTLTIGVDYTLTGADLIDETTGARTPGSVTMTAAPLAGDSLRITRNTPVLQPTHFRTQGPFLPSTHEESLDRATMWGEDLERRVTVLEAGATPVALTASRVTDTFTPTDPIEGNFPRVVACSGTPTMVLLARIEDLTTGTTIAVAGGFADWGSPALNSFTVKYIPGLVPNGDQYRITYLVLTL